VADRALVSWRERARGARAERLLRVTLVVYVLAVAAALLAPSSDVQDQIAQQVGDLGVRLGFSPETASRNHAEVLLNIAVLAPVPLLGSLLWPRVRWRYWIGGALLVSVGVELVQGLLLPDRTPSVRDVVTNTVGAGVGAVLGTGIRRLGRWLSRGRADLSRPRTAAGTPPTSPTR
jgi:hypothetical protein